jgi:outer membrane lipoprotein SlyB
MKCIRSILAIVISFILVGCASKPNAVGSGYGSGYTPVIDGPQDGKYWNNLNECRTLASQVQSNREGEAAGKAVAGALAGALVGGLLGGKGNRNESSSFGAKAGALTGGAEGLGSAAQGGKQVIVNCMVGRGYRVLG